MKAEKGKKKRKRNIVRKAAKKRCQTKTQKEALYFAKEHYSIERVEKQKEK